MKNPRSHRPRSISYRMTAMIDMAFLLITFFVMSIRFGQVGEEEIVLPNADQASEVTDERVELITLNVTRGGLYTVNAVQHTPAALLNYLQRREGRAKRKLEVVIRGDRETTFDAIQRAMRISAEAGIPDLSLAALQMPDEAGEQH